VTIPYWLPLAALALAAAGVLYVHFGWRRAPRARRAMFVLAAIYFVAGSILGAWVMHLVARPSAPPEQTATLNPPTTSLSTAASIAAPATPTAAITTAAATPQALNEGLPSPPEYDFSHAILPDSKLTPGDTFPGATAADVCTPGWSTEHRHVTEEMRGQVYAEYGRTRGPDCCEVDHLIPLELGGSNEMRNLWPQPDAPRPGSPEKDQLENELHRLVCSGKLSLTDAQRCIATNWAACWAKYSLPLYGSTR
jgi:hypothetical protein